MPHASRLTIVEVGTTIFLLAVIGLRTFSYPHFADNSHDSGADDGYPYYAKHLDQTGTLLPEFRRLPGYPAFLAASAHLTGWPYSQAGQYVQGALSCLLILGLWLPVRRLFGPLVTVLLLALLAAPNLWVRLSVFAFPDFLSAVLWCAVALTVLRWTMVMAWRQHVIWGGTAFVLVGMMLLLKPGMSILLMILAASLLVAHVLTQRTWTGAGPIAARGAALVAGAVALQTAILAVCGSGSVAFYRNALHTRVVTYLPAATDSPSERVVERTKNEIAQREGQRMEDENFTNTLAIVQPEIEAVWRDRLRARPLTYIAAMLEEIKRKHHFIAMSFTPFMADTTPNRTRIPKRDESAASRLYRASGLYLHGLGEGVAPTSAALADAVLRLGLFWIPLVCGLWLMGTRWPFATVTAVVCLAGYTVALAFGIFIDGRYLLPFAPLIYVAQAMGLASVIRGIDAHVLPNHPHG
jgi:hypothetical protein